MTTRIVCDLCGNIPDEPRMGSITVRGTDGAVAFAPDVCAECLAGPLVVDTTHRGLARLREGVVDAPGRERRWNEPMHDDQADHPHSWEPEPGGLSARCSVCGEIRP